MISHPLGDSFQVCYSSIPPIICPKYAMPLAIGSYLHVLGGNQGQQEQLLLFGSARYH